MLFDRWYASKEVAQVFVKLRQMILIEGFKGCIPTNIKTYNEEQKAETLQQAARLADDYSLTHHGVFEGSPSESNSAGGPKSEPSKNTDHMNKPSTRNQRRAVPPGPVCHCCKRRIHVMSECWALEKKEKNKHKATLVVRKAESARNATTLTDRSPAPLRVNSTDYEPFISQGLVSLVCHWLVKKLRLNPFVY